jgi:DNA repair protein RadC
MGNSKSRVVRMGARPQCRLSTPCAIHRLVQPVFMGLDREHLWRVDLDARDGLLGAELVSIGTVNSAPCHPREVFSRAIACGASRIVLVHNHPTGVLEPSPSDLQAMERLNLCGLILGIDVADSLIVHQDRFLSLKESKPPSLGLERRRNPAILPFPGRSRRQAIPTLLSSRLPGIPNPESCGNRRSQADREGVECY